MGYCPNICRKELVKQEEKTDEKRLYKRRQHLWLYPILMWGGGANRVIEKKKSKWIGGSFLGSGNVILGSHFQYIGEQRKGGIFFGKKIIINRIFVPIPICARSWMVSYSLSQSPFSILKYTTRMQFSNIDDMIVFIIRKLLEYLAQSQRLVEHPTKD